MTEPTEPIISYPMCGRWDCDDDEDWETISPSTPGYGPEFYRAVKREYRIVYYHQPRAEWPQRLRDEREKRSNGDPLWWASR